MKYIMHGGDPDPRDLVYELRQMLGMPCSALYSAEQAWTEALSLVRSHKEIAERVFTAFVEKFGDPA